MQSLNTVAIWHDAHCFASLRIVMNYSARPPIRSGRFLTVTGKYKMAKWPHILVCRQLDYAATWKLCNKTTQHFGHCACCTQWNITSHRFKSLCKAQNYIASSPYCMAKLYHNFCSSLFSQLSNFTQVHLQLWNCALQQLKSLSTLAIVQRVVFLGIFFNYFASLWIVLHSFVTGQLAYSTRYMSCPTFVPATCQAANCTHLQCSHSTQLQFGMMHIVLHHFASL
jgi:hypothetical protein